MVPTAPVGNISPEINVSYRTCGKLISFTENCRKFVSAYYSFRY
jgi:hypothetical protein